MPKEATVLYLAPDSYLFDAIKSACDRSRHSLVHTKTIAEAEKLLRDIFDGFDVALLNPATPYDIDLPYDRHQVKQFANRLERQYKTVTVYLSGGPLDRKTYGYSQYPEGGRTYPKKEDIKSGLGDFIDNLPPRKK